MAALASAGISIDAVTAQRLNNGILLFVKAFDNLLGAIQRKISIIIAGECDRS
jgi:hypothetical protein